MKNDAFWKHKKVLVTGGAGFIGSHVVEMLVEKGAVVTVADSLGNGKERNLASIRKDISLISDVIGDIKSARAVCKGQDVVMNLAAKVGGISYNLSHHGTMLFKNIHLSTIMTEAARAERVERFLVVSSACVYSSSVSIPTREDEGFLGEPDPSNSGYGWAKRMAELLGKYYAQEFGMKIAIVRPYNCYGPRDHFDPKSSHVIPALIKRVFDGENPVRVWGSGAQTRAFLFVKDLADGMIRAIERYPVPDPINLGSDEEISIKDLVETIVRISKVNTKVEFDKTKPDGSPRRNSDNSKAIDKIGFRAKTSLSDGLAQTIGWYKNELERNT